MASLPNERCSTCWRTMATIEVDRIAGALDDVLEDISFDSRLEPSPSPHPDVLRFDLIVNASRGDDRAAAAAFALLSALEAIAENGSLPGFRIVAGEHWLREEPPIVASGSRASPSRSPSDAPPPHRA
ncbi:MAG TPA: hypothetical protein VJX31_09865 [Casimicrobiaceae bacterium]|nr:hypothetical protein [Casimicrobiaceae bacterium]